MKFQIDKQLLATSRHLLYDDAKLYWIDSFKDNVYTFSTVEKQSYCLNTLFRLEHFNVPVIDERYKNVLKTLAPTGSFGYIPSQFLMPKHHIQDNIKKITLNIVDTLTKCLTNYYDEFWVPETAIFNRLATSFVDKQLVDALLDDINCGNKSVVRTFYTQSGKLPKVTYNRFGTRTGRLTVSNGPQILTLKKELRNILKTRFSNGTICYYDFNALEVRIALYEAGFECNDIDVYNSINKVLYDSRFDRDVIKGIVISKLYGRNDYITSSKLNIDKSHLNVLLTGISEYLKIDDLYSKSKNDYIKNGFIRNKFGRKIIIDDPLVHIIANSYVQSTGVDVSLLGFLQVSDIVESLGGLPIFLIHDAILFDAENYDSLPPIIWVSIPKFNQKFPLKLRKVNI